MAAGYYDENGTGRCDNKTEDDEVEMKIIKLKTNIEKAILNEQIKNEKSMTGDYFFINLYPTSISGCHWYMYRSYREAVNQSTEECLHVGMPVHKDMIETISG